MNIIDLVKKAGDWNGQTAEFNDVGLERFVALIRAEALEEAAKVVDHVVKAGGDTYGDVIRGMK